MSNRDHSKITPIIIFFLEQQCAVILSWSPFAVRLVSVHDDIHLSAKIGAEFWILLSLGRLLNKY